MRALIRPPMESWSPLSPLCTHYSLCGGVDAATMYETMVSPVPSIMLNKHGRLLFCSVLSGVDTSASRPVSLSLSVSASVANHPKRPSPLSLFWKNGVCMFHLLGWTTHAAYHHRNRFAGGCLLLLSQSDGPHHSTQGRPPTCIVTFCGERSKKVARMFTMYVRTIVCTYAVNTVLCTYCVLCVLW